MDKERVCTLDFQTMFQDAFIDKMPEGLDDVSGPAWIEEKYCEYKKGFNVCENCSNGEKSNPEDCLFFEAEKPRKRKKRA